MKKLILLILVSFQSTTYANDLSFITLNEDQQEKKQDTLLIQEIVDAIPEWDTKTQNRVKKYAPLIIEVANQLEMDAELLLSIAWTESHFNPNAKSNAGALGLMQVKDDTKAYIFKKSPEHTLVFTSMLSMTNDTKSLENIIAGSLYIKYLLEKYEGNKQRAIIAYNEGPTGTYRLIKKKYNLNKHLYFRKVAGNMDKMNITIDETSVQVMVASN